MAQASNSDDPSPFDIARENDQRVNEMLAETDGAIASMQYQGTIGYHIHVARGESDPEYLWKIALLEALDEAVFQQAYVDAEDPTGARRQIERALSDAFNPMTADYLAEQFEEKLRDLMETQQEHASGDGS